MSDKAKVRVKPLEWNLGPYPFQISADTVSGVYGIEDEGEGWGNDRYWAFSNNYVIGKFATELEAQVALQADHEEAILSVIEEVPEYETCKNCAGSGLTLNIIGEPDECPECHGNTVVPKPDTRDVALEEAERALETGLEWLEYVDGEQDKSDFVKSLLTKDRKEIKAAITLIKEARK